MRFERCTTSDLRLLCSIGKQTFIEAFEKASNPESFELYIAKAFEPDVILAEIKDPQCAFFMCYDDETNDVLGYIKLRWDRSDEFFGDAKALEIQRIYVLEKHWRKGYGKKMLDFIENWAKNTEELSNNIGLFEWVFLVVWCENEAAIRFYEREGYEKFARKDFNFGNEIHNDFVMRKNVY